MSSRTLLPLTHPPPLTHLQRLTDGVGMHEHAYHASPRREHGYCVDDNARAVVVLARDGRHAAEALMARCLRFVLDMQAPDGTFHNRCGAGRRRTDTPGTGDHWGRALWGLGCAAAHRPHVAPVAAAAFLRGARHRSAHPRAMAYAALGAAALLEVATSERDVIAGLLRDAATTIGAPGRDGRWPWPGPRLTYANARLPEALIAVGTALHDDRVLGHGLALLRWLVDIESAGATVSVTPVGGWALGEPRPGFDQQPIEVWALADAAVRAWEATGDAAWATVVRRCADWFLGGNDCGLPLFDERTGGGCDGLEAGGRNENQGAESTLALVATLQAARRTSA